MNPAVFFDRDGVLNELVNRDGGQFSPQEFAQFIIVDGAKIVINKLKELGFLIIIISNQPDISRKSLKKTDLDRMTNVLFNELMVDDVFYCTHDDSDFCNCRKPAPGLFIQAAEKWNIDLRKSYMVGDTWKDAEAAENANVNFLLLDREYNLDFNSPNRIYHIKDIYDYIER